MMFLVTRISGRSISRTSVPRNKQAYASVCTDSDLSNSIEVYRMHFHKEKLESGHLTKALFTLNDSRNI